MPVIPVRRPRRVSLLSRYATRASASVYPGLWRDLVAAWPMCLGYQGNRVYNLVRPYDGQLTNMPVDTVWVADPIGVGLRFGGAANHHVRTAGDVDEYDFAGASAGPITIVVWLRCTTSANGTVVMKGGWNTSNPGWRVGLSSSTGQTLFFGAWSSSNGYTTPWANDPIADDQVHHIALIVPSSGIPTLYLDGRQRTPSSSVSSGTESIGPSTRPVGIGGRPDLNDLPLNGVIYDVRIYRRALTPGEIALDYADPFGLYRLAPVLTPVSRVSLLVRAAQETVRMQEGHIRRLSLLRSRSETTQVPEGRSRLLSLLRSRPETVRMQEGSISLREVVRWVGETVRIHELLTQAFLVTRLLSETVRLLDSSLYVKVLVAAQSEAIRIYEAYARARALMRVRTEVLSVGEVRRLTLLLRRVLGETVRGVESIARLGYALRLVSEGVRVLEAAIRSMAILRARGEVVRQVEMWTRSQLLVRWRNEVSRVYESRPFRRALVRKIAEEVRLVEGVATVLAAAEAFLYGMVAVARVVPRLLGRVRVLKPPP